MAAALGQCSALVATLLLLLAASAAAFLAGWVWLRRRAPQAQGARPSFVHIAVGAVTNFFDTLGVGSFATTTVLFRLARLVPDEEIPGTLNVGHALPMMLQAVIFIAAVAVDPLTLVVMIAAAVVGAFLGAGVVARWPRVRIQRGMGVLLLLAGAVMVVRALHWLPTGTALALTSWRLPFAAAVNFSLGALMTLGIGLYAPCLVLVSSLGLDVKAAFPIMMGSCAFLAPAAGLRFIASGRYRPAAALGLLVGGLPAVLIAAFVVRELPVTALQWVVAAVVVYTAAVLLRAARRENAKVGR